MEVYNLVISTHIRSAGKKSPISCYIPCIHKILRGNSDLDVSSSGLTTLSCWSQPAMWYLLWHFLQPSFLPNSSAWFVHTISHTQVSVMNLWASSFICLHRTGRLAHPNGFHACQFNHSCVEVLALVAWSDLAVRCVYTRIYLCVVYTVWVWPM